MSKLLLISLLITVLTACGGDASDRQYHIKYTIASVDRCISDDDAFRVQCVARTTSGIYVYTDDLVAPGTVVYKLCWDEDDGSFCFKNVSTYLRSDYGDEERF